MDSIKADLESLSIKQEPKWVDITDLVEKSVAELQVGQFMSFKTFHLVDAMSAIEVIIIKWLMRRLCTQKWIAEWTLEKMALTI
jgi:hypothetical protein